MKLSKKRLIILLLIAGPAVVTYFLFFSHYRPKAGYIQGRSNTISRAPGAYNNDTATFDFSKCSTGSDMISIPFGSLHFVFEGIKGDKCVFYYGGEIENPKWNKVLNYKCSVPVNTDPKTYRIADLGIVLNDLDEFCKI